MQHHARCRQYIAMHFDEEFGEKAELPPSNLVDEKQFELRTPSVVIKVDPEHSDLVETRIINGCRYILIDASEGVEVNGVNIQIEESFRHFRFIPLPCRPLEWCGAPLPCCGPLLHILAAGAHIFFTKKEGFCHAVCFFARRPWACAVFGAAPFPQPLSAAPFSPAGGCRLCRHGARRCRRA